MGPSYGTNRTAPLGIKILCVLGAMLGVLGLFGGFGMAMTGGSGIVVGPLAILLSLAQLVVVWGLWTLQSWAWTLTLVVYGIGLLEDVFRLLTGNAFAIVGILVGFALLVYVYSKRDYYR